MQLLYRTKYNDLPNGLFRIYYCAHPDEYKGLFPEICEDIHRHKNCAIWYKDTPSDSTQPDLLDECNLMVVAVTSTFLQAPSIARDVELSYALEHHIPILPIVYARDMEEEYTAVFGPLQYLARFEMGNGALTYHHKLRVFLTENTVSERLVDRITDSFDATFFLSYRKKDRLAAMRLIHAIHNDKSLQHIAIWYDEYLSIGEDFNQSITTALDKSLLFILAVTRNMVGEDNYVSQTEYPLARKRLMRILPVALESVDTALLNMRFPDIPVPLDEGEQAALQEILRNFLRENNVSVRQDPSTTYYLALAYFFGIYVEQNPSISLSFLETCANEGYPEALGMLADIYAKGYFVEQDFRRAIHYQTRLVTHRKAIYEDGHLSFDLPAYVDAMVKLAELHMKAERYRPASSLLNRCLSLSDDLTRHSLDQVHTAFLHLIAHETPAENLLIRVEKSINGLSFDMLLSTVYKLLSLAASTPRYEELRDFYRDQIESLPWQQADLLSSQGKSALSLSSAYSLRGSLEKDHFGGANAQAYFNHSDSLCTDKDPINHGEHIVWACRDRVVSNQNSTLNISPLLSAWKTVRRVNRMAKKSGIPFSDNTPLPPSAVKPFVDRLLARDLTAEFDIFSRAGEWNDDLDYTTETWLQSNELLLEKENDMEEALRIYEKCLAISFVHAESILLRYVDICARLYASHPQDTELLHKQARSYLTLVQEYATRRTYKLNPSELELLSHEGPAPLPEIPSPENISPELSVSESPPIEEIIPFGQKAYLLYKSYLQLENSDEVWGELCTCCRFLGDLYGESGQADSAIEMLSEAYEISRQLFYHQLDKAMTQTLDLHLRWGALGLQDSANRLKKALLLIEYLTDADARAEQRALAYEAYASLFEQDRDMEFTRHYRALATREYHSLYEQYPDTYLTQYCTARIRQATVGKERKQRMEMLSQVIELLKSILEKSPSVSRACLLAYAYIEYSKDDLHESNTVTYAHTALELLKPYDTPTSDSVANMRTYAHCVLMAHCIKNKRYLAATRQCCKAMRGGMRATYRREIAGGIFNWYFQ